MPAPGVPNNPNGANGTEGVEQPYGAVKRLAQQTQAAPLPANHALASPRRAQRAAQRPTGPPQEPQHGQPHPIESQPMALPVLYAQAWSAVAADPGASPLVQQMAQEAQRGV